MRQIVLIISLILCILVAGAVAQDQPTTTEEATSAIPNLTVEPEDTNGRAAQLDQEKESGEELTAVEQKIIRRDTIRSNPTIISPAN